MLRKRTMAAALCAMAVLAAPSRAAAQSCSPSYRDVALAIYAQVWELGGGRGQDFWATKLSEGTTVKEIVSTHIRHPDYRARFITGHDSRTVLTYLYQHLLAREPDDTAWGWVTVGETSGWEAVMDGLLNSTEYNTRFGSHVVPGSPIVSWDCARATGVFEAHHNSIRDVTQGAANVSYATPSYVSLDQPRSLTFVYSAGMVRPTALVQVNVIDNTGDAPNRASLRLQVNGAWVTDEVFFTAGAGATRLAASFDARGRPSGALPVTAVVRKYWPDGRMQEHSLATRAIVIDERYSTIGNGWVVAGVQKLRDQGDGVFISESGTGTWFAKLGNDADGSSRYASPPGDFTRVVREPGGTYRRDYPDGTRVHFSAGGKMTEGADRFGNTTTYGYGSDERLYTVTDPLGKQTVLYYGCCAVTAIQDPTGRRVYTETYGSALFRFKEPETNAMALDINFAADGPEGWLLDTYWTGGGDRNAGAHTGWTVGYDPHYKLASVTAPQVSTTDTGSTRPVTRFRSLEAAVLAPAGTGTSASPAPRLQPHQVRVEATDPRGYTSRAVLSPLGAPVRMQNAVGDTSIITRDRHGRVVRAEGPTGFWTTYTYVGVELRKAVDMNGSVVDVEYEPVYHQPTHIRGTGMAESWMTYDTADPQRKLLSTRTGTAFSPETGYTYTTRGRVASVTDPEGHGAFYTYGDETGGNSSGNLHQVSVGTASGTYRRTTTHTYDALGRTVAVVGPASDTTRTEYDASNRVTRTWDATSNVTTYTHRPTGLYEVSDAKGQVYTWNRNLLGWVESEIDPRSQYTYYGYDRAGNTTSMTNRRGQAITSAYDALGRMTSRTADGQQASWLYGPAGRWMQASNAESVNLMEYDVAGRPTRVVSTMGGVTHTQEVAYDTAGRRTRVDVAGPWAGARSIRYGYNGRGQLDTLWNFAGGATEIQYDEDGQAATFRLPTGLYMGREFVSTHAPSRIWIADPLLNERLGSRYRYGAKGLVDARATKYSDYSGTGDLVRSYGYNRHGWLTSAADDKYPAGAEPCDGTQDINPDTGVTCTPQGMYPDRVWQASWTYDQVGNRINNTATLEAGNRLAYIDGWQFSYDADGNVLGKLKPNVDQLGLAWNSLGQATGAWRAGYGSITYGYDAFGRRVRRTAPDGSVTRFLYDGDDLLMELDGAGNPIREYTFYPGVDKPHSVRVSATGAAFYYVTDVPGNVVGLINGANQVVNQYRYGPWGEVEQATEGVQQPLRYAAREWDAGAGLYQVRARWYDPQFGRFVSEDPIGLAGGINQYAYAGNTPVNMTDPSGLCGVWFEKGVLVVQSTTGGCNWDALENNISFEGLVDFLRGLGGGGGSTLMGGGLGGSGGGGSAGRGATASQPGPLANFIQRCTQHAMKVHNQAWTAAGDGAIAGAAVGTVWGGYTGSRIGAGAGGAAGGVVATAVSAPTFIAAPLAGAIGISAGTAGGAWAGGIVGAHAGFYAGGSLGWVAGYISTGITAGAKSAWNGIINGNHVCS